MRLSAQLSFVLANVLCAQVAYAQGQNRAPNTQHAPTSNTPPKSHSVEVRLALSAVAAESLSEIRLRRLLDIELPDTAQLAAGSTGPLSNDVAYVWIDRPAPERLEIQVRLDGRGIVRRELAIAELTSDVAVRLVVITTSEMIRAEIRRRRAPRRPPTPRGPSLEEIERVARDKAALSLSTDAYLAVLPTEPTLFGGPGARLSFRWLRVTESIFAHWLEGPTGDGTIRWLEAGVMADYRFWLSSSWRLSLGAAAAAASLRLTHVASVDNIKGEQDTWSARVGLAMSAETRLGGPLVLGLSLEPGVILRRALYEDVVGTNNSVHGVWLGLGVSLSLEQSDTTTTR